MPPRKFSSIDRSRSFRVDVQQTAQHIRRGRATARRVIAVWRKTFAVFVLASFITVCVAVWPFTRAHLQAMAVLRVVAGQPAPWLAAKLVVQPVTTEEIQIPDGSSAIRARLYRPANSAHAPGLVVLHGVHHLGMDEPRLMGFAAAMASCGLQVLTPELPGIRDYRIDKSAVLVIGESTRWFAQKTGGPVGVMGLSFSGGLALVSASDPLYRLDFKFVFAVGSQDNMDHVAQFCLTGAETCVLTAALNGCARMNTAPWYWSMSILRISFPRRTWRRFGLCSDSICTRGQGCRERRGRRS